MDVIFQTILEWTAGYGYLGVFLLMMIESSFVPFPSEIVIPPAAYLAYQGEMNVFLVVFFGVLGSLFGAIINYFLAMWLGRPIVYSLTEKKWTSVFLINAKKVERAEGYFLKYGGVSTFLGRLVPAVRQLISLPAGFVRMNFVKFIFFTILGAGFWVTILAILGYYFGAKEEVFLHYYSETKYLVLAVVLMVVLAFLLYSRFNKRRKKIFN